MSKKKAKSKAAKSGKKAEKKHRFPKALPEETLEAAPGQEEGIEIDEETVPAEEHRELNLEFAEDSDEDATMDFVETEEDEAVATEEEIEGLIADASGDDEELVAAGTEESREAGEENEESAVNEEESAAAAALADTELGEFDSAQIEDVEVLTGEQVRSIVESVLFSTDKPMSIAVIKQAFKGTNVKSKDIRECLTALVDDYRTTNRGFDLLETGGGFQLRTKPENMKYLRQSVKARPFRLSGPALEVLSIVAYKQPVTKSQIDEIRGVESGHLLRALMEKSIITFGERSDLPGKPMFYETTRKFLEIFGLRNLQELPSLHEIDQLMPEGIGVDEKKETLSDLTGQLSTEVGEGSSYSVGEDELLKITDELNDISTSSEFFDQEKERMRQKRDAERARDIRERQLVGETVDEKDVRWLERHDAAQAEAAQGGKEVDFVTDGILEEAGGAAAEHLGETESGADEVIEVQGLETDALEGDADPERELEEEAIEMISETEDEDLEREPEAGI